jgi:hypothetical protein
MLRIKKLSRFSRSIFLLLCGVLTLYGGGTVQAISQADLYSINTNTSFFDPSATNDSCTSTSGTFSAAAGTDTPKWQTALQAPYNLEDFVVEVLSDIAGKEGVPTTSTVTPQHVLALVAFAYGEGGNLTNDDIYNPWNTGYTGSDLQPVGGHSASGVQSYASFNDGVEATARVMTGTGGSGGYQTRLGDSLKDPSTTAPEFMKTLTYYQNYQNNKPWATASMPPNQESYYQGRLELIQTVQSNYKQIASSVIGPPGNSYNNNQHTDKQLRYSASNFVSNTGGISEAGDGGCSGVGAVQGNIVQTALNFAWQDVTYPYHGDADTASCYDSAGQAVSPEPSDCHHGFQQLGVHDPSQYTKPSYIAAVQQYESGVDSTSYTDCGVFVATVMRASGVDPKYVASGTGSQLDNVMQRTDKYLVINSVTSSTQLQPGDILVNSSHTYIYVGKQPGGFSVVEASQGNHSPELDNMPYFSNEGESFSLVRVKN